MRHELLLSAVLALASASRAQDLPDLYRISPDRSHVHVEYHQVTIAPGQETVLADLLGSGKVTYFYITDSTQVHWYPGLVLKIFWDGESQPSVLVPLADFFGAIQGRTIDYQSTPMQINHGCYMCYLPMPFSRQARFVLANDGDRAYSESMAYGIDYETGPAFAGEKSRLHCSWRRSNPVQNGLHTILEARGEGHYIGSFLQVRTRCTAWWGEGDTIFHIDGEPITHTPGTEDEYGSCWGFGHLYSYLNSGYIEMEDTSGTDNANRMYRWYLTNPVRFHGSLKVEIQNQHIDGVSTTTDADDYVSVAYWYQDEPHLPLALAPFHERAAPSR